MFRKVVSRLAYSPATLWQLGSLDEQNRKKLKATKQLIIIVLLNIFLFSILYLSQVSNSIRPLSIETRIPEELDATIKISTEDAIRTNQNVDLIFELHNKSLKDFSGDILINFNGAEQYFINPNETMKWKIARLEPEQSINKTVSLQSLNSFGYVMRSSSDTCNLFLTFGNTTELRFNCPRTKLLNIKLEESLQKTNFYLWVLVLLVVILVVKLISKAEVTLALKESRLLRQRTSHRKALS